MEFSAVDAVLRSVRSSGPCAPFNDLLADHERLLAQLLLAARFSWNTQTDSRPTGGTRKHESLQPRSAGGTREHESLQPCSAVRDGSLLWLGERWPFLRET